MAEFALVANIGFVAPSDTPPTPVALLLLLFKDEVGIFVTDSGGVSGGFQPP